jgi:steroid 5-alpha reductase family enzyme
MSLLLLTIGGIIFCFVSSLFLLSLLIKRNDIADVAWGIGIVLVAGSSYVLATEKSIALQVMLLLVVLWGLRLATRIFLRNMNKGEDFRYKKWREEWGKWFHLRSYAQVYLLQGLLMILIGYPVAHMSVYGAGTHLSIFSVMGIIVWCVGYFFEVVGDWQLDRFLSNPENKGKMMTVGLWRYTRHPNYFGEVTMWWGLWFMVATLPLGYIAAISPVTITFLILKVSGIPMLEKKFEDNKEFQTYKARTSAFFPLPPKRTS